MLEAYTALGALATATDHVALGALVTGNTYRNPTLLAKAVTTLDMVSSGRAVLGMGAGWFELEHTQLGFEFGTFTLRFAKLEEALHILVPMLAGERVTFAGRFYRTCAEFDRDPATLETSVLLTVVPDTTFTDDMVPPAMRGRVAVGSPERIAETVKANVVDVGIGGVIVNMPRYVPGSITAVGQALREVVGR